LKVSDLDDIYIVATSQNFFHVSIQAEKIWLKINEKNIIIQPQMKETLPIIALASRIIWEWNILMLPSDHLIPDEEKFSKIVFDWIKYLDKWILTFWIKPLKIETWYWYIEKSSDDKVLKFHEKPNEEMALEYIKKWFLWNCWIYFFNYDFFFKELKILEPNIYNLIFDKSKTDAEIFEEIEAVSIDKWISEKSANMYCLEMDLKWSDLWSFDSIWEYMEENNIQPEKILSTWDTKNNVVLSENNNKEIALIDVEDLVIVDSDDVLLISKRWSTQKVKELVKKTKKTNWNTEYRPWWSFTILSQWKWYKTKKISVLPGRKLSLQSHHHRSEHWVVIEWTALVTIWENEIVVPKWESVFVPIWEKHRLANPWKVPLSIIESQIWDYLEEDDIVRYSDDFWRK
jgi:mannose-1-phosphate guanylyltransferase/mannose-6-phosphate isomerase